nr:cobalamin B12-binding domain-containing protein [uncultured Rhodopila sp.]
MLSPIKNSNNEPSAGRKPIGVDHGVKRSRRGRKAAFCRQWRSDGLTRTIEDRVLPKLALAHRHDAAGGPDTAPGAAELEDFLTLVLADDLPACIARIERLAARGAGLADICLGLLAPAARRLGTMWDDDSCSFVDVTTGLGMLRSALYRLREICPPDMPVHDGSRRVLLASLSGDRHSFGLQVVSEVFCHAGWDVTVAIAATDDELVEAVRGRWFAVAGLSVARAEQTGTLGRTIRAIRGASRNRAIGVLAGGPALSGAPDLARLAGADATAGDARQAVAQAESLRLLMASLEVAVGQA